MLNFVEYKFYGADSYKRTTFLNHIVIVIDKYITEGVA